MHLYEHQIATNASQQMTKVTEMVREDIERSGVREGIAVIFSPHTTAGFTINENADPDVVHDMLCGCQMTIRSWFAGKSISGRTVLLPACRRKFACTYEDDGGRTVTDADHP